MKKKKAISIIAGVLLGTSLIVGGGGYYYGYSNYNKAIEQVREQKLEELKTGIEESLKDYEAEIKVDTTIGKKYFKLNRADLESAIEIKAMGETYYLSDETTIKGNPLDGYRLDLSKGNTMTNNLILAQIQQILDEKVQQQLAEERQKEVDAGIENTKYWENKIKSDSEALFEEKIGGKATFDSSTLKINYQDTGEEEYPVGVTVSEEFEFNGVSYIGEAVLKINKKSTHGIFLDCFITPL